MSAAVPSGEPTPAEPTPPVEPTPDSTPAPAPAAEPSADPLSGDAPSADTPKGFTDLIDSDLRENPIVQRYKTATDAAKALIEQRQLLSRQGFKRPPEDATPQQVRAAMTEWGCPESPTGYDFDVEIPEGIVPESAVVDAFLETMHHVGLLGDQAKPLFEKFYEVAAQSQEAEQARAEELGTAWTEERRKRWGEAHDSKVDVATRAIRFAFPDQAVLDEIRQARLPSGGVLGDYIGFWEGMSRMAEVVPQEHPLLGDKEPTRYSTTPDDAKSEITKMKADPAFRAAFAKPVTEQTPQEKDQIARYRSLFPKAYPGRSPE